MNFIVGSTYVQQETKVGRQGFWKNNRKGNRLRQLGRKLGKKNERERERERKPHRNNKPKTGKKL
jgi:hypothetical protein